MSTPYPNENGWAATTLFSNIQSIYNILPEEVKAGVKEVEVPYHVNHGSPLFEEIATTSCRIFTPSHTEMGGSHYIVESCGSQFPLFTDNASRIKKSNNGAGIPEEYITRSMNKENNRIVYIDQNGAVQWQTPNLGDGYPTCFLFNI